VALPDPSDSSAALITGASSGIGAAIARELAGRGHNLILVARRADRLAELAAELSAAAGVRAEPVAADLAEDGERDRLAAEVERLDLAVEVLVNCAGFGGAGDLHLDDREHMVSMVRLNCDALLDLQARYAPAMAERGRGAIINLASTAAFQPMPGNATYAATKAFVNTFSESIRGELKRAGVHVTVLAPGPVRETLPDTHEQSLVEKLIPDFLWISTEYTAKVSLDGLERNKMRVVPGATSKAMSVASGYTPRSIVSPIVGAVYKRLGGG
jgi:short-subunit dehydrogenase